MAIKFDLALCRRVAIFAVILHLVLALDNCPCGWNGYGNSCYQFVHQLGGVNWESARRDCLGSGGDLVSITDQSEMSFVSNKSINAWNQHYWIGLNDRRNESQFVWSDGTPYNVSVYSNWHQGEPSDRSGEDCVELYRTRWNDNGCKEEFGYICEKLNEPPICLTPVTVAVTSGPPIHVTPVTPSVTSVPPRIMKDVCPTSVTCKRYTVCSLCCYATSDSPVKYSWTKNGKKPKNGEIKIINDNIVITPRSAKDYGVYVCNALNSYGSTSYEITLTEDEMSQEDDGLSSVYRIIVIALSCIVLVLLIAVGLLTWRLTRALINKREKTHEGGTSYEVEHHDTPRDQHVSQEDGYLEPLEVMPPAISHYQSIHSNGTAAKYDNLVSNSGTDNGEEDELYLTIIP